MNYLYIGPISSGSTTKMRLDSLKKLLPDSQVKVIDTSIPEKNTNRSWRSLGWRLKFGPLVNNVSDYIAKKIGPKYDFIWVDKAVFIKPTIIKKLRSVAPILIHFTPDPAFTYHRSRLFFESIPYFDYCLTTKDFEINQYYQARAKKVILIPQGYDPTVHHPYYRINEKSGVCFIGHYEKESGLVIETLINANIQVKLAGIKWRGFAQKHKKNPYLIYLGDGLFGERYTREISGSLMALGLLSKWIPENITTRTIEIPACGTALLTEKTDSVKAIFKNDEVVYFKNIEELKNKITFYLSHPEKLKSISAKGLARVQKGFDYHSIMKKCLKEIGIL